MLRAFGDPEYSGVAGRILAVDELIGGARRWSPVPGAGAERMFPFEEWVEHVFAGCGINWHAVQGARSVSITDARTILSPDGPVRAEVLDAVARDRKDRRLNRGSRAHVDTGCEPTIVTPDRDDCLRGLAEVSHLVEDQGLSRAGRQRDLLRLGCSRNVHDEDSRACLRLFVKRLVVAQRDAHGAFGKARELGGFRRVCEFSKT